MLSKQSKLELIESCYTGLQLKLRSLYLEWVNNYISYTLMAEHKGISEDTLQTIIAEGRAIHESIASQYKQATA